VATAHSYPNLDWRAADAPHTRRQSQRSERSRRPSTWRSLEGEAWQKSRQRILVDHISNWTRNWTTTVSRHVATWESIDQ